MEKLKVMYFSPTGGTETVVKTIATAWEEELLQIDLTDVEADFGQCAFNSDDICIVGAPAFGGRIPKAAADAIGKMNGRGAWAVPVVVYGNRAYEDALLELSDCLCKQGFRMAGGVAAVAEHSIMRQFAAGRPDEEDKQELLKFGKSLREMREKERSENAADFGDAPADVPETIGLPGNRPYREYGVIPMRPAAGAECTKCGLCAERCPVRAIPKDAPEETEEGACISCMRCIAICPHGVRSLNPQVVDAVAEKMKAAFEGRKSNELFLK